MGLARDERADLSAFLAKLSSQQWDAPTLCEKWRVRDVVAHIISYDDLDRRGLIKRFAAARFAPERVNALGVTEARARTPQELLTALNSHLEPRGLTAGFGGRVALVDGMIHHQDIRRPLGMPREIPADRLLPAWSSRASHRPSARSGAPAAYASSPPTWTGPVVEDPRYAAPRNRF